MSWTYGKRALVSVLYKGGWDEHEATFWDCNDKNKMLQVVDVEGVIHSYPTYSLIKFKVTPIKDDKNGN